MRRTATANGLAIQILFVLVYNIGHGDGARRRVHSLCRTSAPPADTDFGAKMEGLTMAQREQRSNRETRKPKKAKAAAKGPATSTTASGAKPNPPPAWKQTPPKT